MRTITVLVFLLLSNVALANSQNQNSAYCENEADILKVVEKANHPAVESPRHQEKLRRLLQRARRMLFWHVEDVLNEPDQAGLRNELKSLAANVESDAKSSKNDYMALVHTFERVVAKKGLIKDLAKTVEHQYEVPNYSKKDYREHVKFKLRDLREPKDFRGFLKDGVFHLPFEYMHFSKEDPTRGVHYQFELALQFQPDGSIKLVDNGATTFLGIVGKCDQDDLNRTRNEYFENYTQMMNGKCVHDDQTHLFEDYQLEDLNLMVKHDPTTYSRGQVFGVVSEEPKRCDPEQEKKETLIVAQIDTSKRNINQKVKGLHLKTSSRGLQV